jgi:fatty-acyl-CoA synthase
VEKRVGSVGRIHPHVEIKVIDPESGRIMPRGTSGELCTRGYVVMLGYWNQPEATAAAIDGARWMHSGDLATMDDEGYLKIVGRIKDMIIRGGENVYPREIEDYLFRHPDIREAQVFGIPDRRFGEQVCAWVVPHEGTALAPEDVVAFCRGRIAHFKVPKHVRIVDELPMTVTGKPQKFIMRDWMVENGYADA